MKKHQAIELVAMIILIPTFTILAHLYGYWVWGIFAALGGSLFAFFYFDAVLREKRLGKMLAEKEAELKAKWNTRKELRKHKNKQ
jgi:hypothetical protein